MENNNSYIFAFATFGHPNDFRQTPLKNNNPELAKQVKVFDLSNAIKVFPNSTVYSIRKELIGNSKLISYSIYTYAQEQTSKRDGTFIGSSIILENNLAEEKYVISCLNEFHQKLTENNLNNGVLKVNHSKDFLPVDSLTDYDKINKPQIQIKDLNFNTTNNNLVVFCKTSVDTLSDLFKKSIDLLNNYDTIYFTNSEEVAKFVLQKGIFKLTQQIENEKNGFESEINNLIEERKRKRDNSISEFERDIQKIKEEKNTNIQEYQSQIQQKEKTHNDNAIIIKESIENIDKIAHFYDDFVNKTYNLINQLKNDNRKIEEVKQAHNSNKILFINSIGELKKTPNYITNIPKSKPKSNLQTSYPQQILENTNGQKKNTQKARGKFNIYKIATFILSFFLIATWIYILFFRANFNIENVQNQEQDNSVNKEQTTIVEKIQEKTTNDYDLKPAPNGKLEEKEYISLAKKISYKLNIDEVVKIIFENNPTTIKSVYSKEIGIYSNLLITLNKECFEQQKDDNYYFTKDTIRNIPIYKK